MLTVKNLTLTPHIGNATDKTRRRVAEKVILNAAGILKGLPVTDIVNAL